MKPHCLVYPLLCLITLTSQHAQAQPTKQDLQQKLAAVKESMARNQAALRQYTWTEHTDVLHKGEVKKTKDNICRYGPDGNVQKTLIGTPEPEKKTRGLKKKIVEKKIGEITEYMDRAVALIQRYMPPSPQKMQEVLQQGNAAVVQDGQDRVELHFKNYFKSGDSLALSFERATKAISKIEVKSYLDSPQDAVSLDVNFVQLPDGTNYAASALLNGTAKEIQVKISNTNYQKLAQ